jgi:histidinol phosphatase-like enzyme (inositol monophosphatase family)
MSSLEQELASRLEFARSIAREAASTAFAYFGQSDLRVDRKEDQSPVTVADREAEELLRARIAFAFAGDSIEGEEYGKQAGTTAFRWLLDPIDGTKSFVSGVPLFGTMVAVLHEDEPQIGVIEFPALGESIFAAKGQGAWHSVGGGSAVRTTVSKIDQLSESLFCTTALDSFESSGRSEIFTALARQARITRTWGDCYGYLLVATGRADLMIDPILNPWDTAALMPILEESGGTLTDFSGRRTIFGGEAVATNGHLLSQTLELTSV